MDQAHSPIDKPFQEWQIVGLIVLVLAAFGFGQAVKTRVNNFPEAPLNSVATTTKLAVDIPNTTIVNLAGKLFSVSLAVTPEEQNQGLSGRPSLGPSEGMLFVLSQMEKPNFWMKDMNFPIDIIWLDENQKIVDLTPGLTPQTFPQTFSPTRPVKYVLEVPADTALQNHLKIGDLIHFSLPATL